MNRRPVYQGRVVNLGIETAVFPDGRRVEIEVIRHPGAAAVLPVHDDGSVTLIRQHRHAAGGLTVEVPAGVLEPGERPEECAARELAEEAQLRAARLRLLGAIHTTPGFTDERIWLFAAEGLEPAPGAPEADEYIRVERISAERALAMVREGAITDGKTICALHLGLCGH